MKALKVILAALISLVLAFGVLMIFKAFRSHKMNPEVGVINDQLRACGQKPNCISSFAEQGTSFYYAPIESNNIESVWDSLNILLSENPYKVESSSTNYIHATATTSLLKFVDDLEFLLSVKDGKIFVRSASRVGRSDLGTNRKRMDKIVQRLLK